MKKKRNKIKENAVFCGHKNNIWWTKITIICIECYTTKHLIHMD